MAKISSGMAKACFRKACLVVLVATGLSACSEARAFVPSQVTAPARSSSLLQPVGGGDAYRLERVRRVSERLFAAAAPFCRGDCQPPVTLAADGLNAYAEGGRITISRGLVDVAQTDDQLALVLSHEMAHLLLGHTGEAASLSLYEGDAREDEREADYVALYLVARAGFEPRDAVGLWQRLGAAQPRLVSAGGVHPGLADRYRAMQHTCAEIEAKLNAGQALVPGS